MRSRAPLVLVPVLSTVIMAASPLALPARDAATRAPLRTPTHPRTAADSAVNALRAAADSFVAAATSLRPTGVWPDYTDATRRHYEARMDRIAAMLAHPDMARLAPPAAQRLRDDLLESVSADRAARVCRRELWGTISPINGWHVTAANWAKPFATGNAPVTPSALETLRALPRTVRMHRQLLQRGLDSGYTSAVPVVDAIAQQLTTLFPDSVATSELVGRLAAAAGDSLARQWTEIVRDSVLPAVREYRMFLTGAYRARARTEGSLATLRAAPGCYAAWLRELTSVGVDLEARAADARLAFTAALRDMAPLVRRLTGDTDVVEGIRALRTGTAFAFPSRDATLAAYRALNTLATERFPRIIHSVQPESLAVLPYGAAEEQADLPPRYLSARGGRSAQFLVNLGRRDRMSAPNAVAHEGYPGHHLQAIAARQATPVHPASQMLFFGSFVEGWGIYAEQLGDELQLYPDDLARAGYLIHLSDVFMAFYLDVGLHHRGWTRAMLVDSMMTLSGRSRSNAEAYADRHASSPGQLATYYVGWRAFVAARAAATRALGARFDLRDFHYEALRDGSMSLTSFERKMTAWIARRRAD